MKNLTISISILAILLTFSVSQISAQCLLGTNRIVNGDAEGNPGATGNVDIANWENETNGFTVIAYSAMDGAGIPGPNSPGAPAVERGSYLFYGGSNSNDSQADQTIDISDCATEIDAGNLRFDLNGYFGGYFTQNDRIDLTVRFRDVAGNVLRTIVIGGVTTQERAFVTGLVYQGRTGLVPTGTRSMVAEMFSDRVGGGSHNNGYADNLNLILNAPTTICPMGSNWLMNSNAEENPNLAGTGNNHEISNWDSETLDFTVVRYSNAGFVTSPPNPGTYFFSGGLSSATSQATQYIDLAGCVSRIDSGQQTYNMSGYFGGFQHQNDRADLNITFLGNIDQTLGTATVGGVLAIDRNDQSGLLFRSTVGLIPFGTRTIKADLVMTRVEGSNNDGYADNLSLMLTEPTAANAVVSGQVLTPKGRAIPNAIIYVTGSNGNSRTARTNHFGYYSFDEIEAGETYIFNAYAKQYQFQTQVVTINESLSNLNFWADGSNPTSIKER